MSCNRLVTTTNLISERFSLHIIWLKLFIDIEQNFVAGDYIQTGPYDAELLYLQNEHRSQVVWNGQVIRNTLQGLFSTVLRVNNKCRNYIKLSKCAKQRIIFVN